MTETLPVHYEPVVASAAIGSLFFAVPVTRIAAWRIRACAARARSGNPPRLVLGNASVSVLRTVDGRSPRSSERDRGPFREASPALRLHAAVAGHHAVPLVTMTRCIPRQCVSLRPINARPARTLAVSAVDVPTSSSTTLAAVPDRPGVRLAATMRSTALTDRVPLRLPIRSPAHRRVPRALARPTAADDPPARQAGPTPFYSPLKSRLYALRRFGSHT